MATVTEETDEMLAFRIIASAGQCRSLAFEALDHARAYDFETADAELAQAKEASLAAHNEQTGLLVKEANGVHSDVCLMMVHAQDHLMTAMLAYELIAEMIEMLKERKAFQDSLGITTQPHQSTAA